MKAAVLLPILLLAGCAAQPQIHWIKVSSVAEASSYCNFARGRAAEPKQLLGCQFWAGKVCTVVAPDCDRPGDLSCFGVLGHEIKHCLEGSFH